MKLAHSHALHLSIWLASAIALASLLLVSGSVGAQPAAQPTPGGQSASTQQPVPNKDRLTEVRKLARTDPAAAGKALRSMDHASLESKDEDTWYDIARSVALRTGDKDWLLSLQDHRSEFSDVYVYRVLLAGGMLEEGRIAEAKAELAKIDDLDSVNVRDRRRAYALQARMAWLEGDAAAERVAVESVVHELQYWGARSCQGCHDDSKYPNQAPLLDVRQTWYAQRLTALMKQQGDATKVKEKAEASLASDPESVDDLLHLAYASMALGKEDEADAVFARIPWVKLPVREGGTPRMMTPYP
jgi:hypothetical protein